MAAPKKYRQIKRIDPLDKPEKVEGVHANLKIGFERARKLHELYGRVKQIKLKALSHGWPQEMADRFDLALINKVPSQTRRQTILRNIFSLNGLRINRYHEPYIKLLEAFIDKIKD